MPWGQDIEPVRVVEGHVRTLLRCITSVSGNVRAGDGVDGAIRRELQDGVGFFVGDVKVAHGISHGHVRIGEFDHQGVGALHGCGPSVHVLQLTFPRDVFRLPVGIPDHVEIVCRQLDCLP